ncbi:MAG: DUF488 domain-containing protein [Chloroflexi bacterium]|nr:DUF488 domain-containing protein [Chloroflexota bacterium]
MAIILKRAYDPPDAQDGQRVLVDRLWPRGIAKEALGIDLWLKEVAPSTELRRWFGHDPTRWSEFRDRYRQELQAPAAKAALDALAQRAAAGQLTLIYGAHDEVHNQAVVIQEVLNERITKSVPGDI